MRRLVPVLAAAAALLACAPASESQKLKLIGEACQKNADCNGDLCQHGVCSRWCSVQGDCPVGFDCGLVDPADKGPLCYKAKWSSPATGGYGTSCALAAGGCGGDNPCAQGFSCLFDAPCDARAYCTKGCSGDADCPPDMFCGERSQADGKQCLQRTSCSPCGTDDQCPTNFVCATAKNGERYCAKTCTQAGDCYKPEKDSSGSGQFVGAPFQVCAADPGGKGDVCQPAGGVCHGPSTISGVSPGGICSPCRVGEPSDCAAGTGCFPADTGESFCTTNCTITATAYNSSGATLTNDSCPTGSYCNFGGPGLVPEYCQNFPCNIPGVCAADASYQAITCYPLSN